MKHSSPSEELTILTEMVYHKAMEYVYGVKTWGIRTPGEVLKKTTNEGFVEHSKGIVIIKEWIE